MAGISKADRACCKLGTFADGTLLPKTIELARITAMNGLLLCRIIEILSLDLVKSLIPEIWLSVPNRDVVAIAKSVVDLSEDTSAHPQQLFWTRLETYPTAYRTSRPYVHSASSTSHLGTGILFAVAGEPFQT